MNTQAWLVAYLNSDGSYRLTIVSEQCPTALCGQWPTSMMSATGSDYASARRNLLAKISRELPAEIAQYGEDDVRVAKGLAPRGKPRPRGRVTLKATGFSR